MENHNIAYFRNLWETNNLDLENQCKNWEKICSDNEIPDEVHGEIRTAIGLARLLMNQKLKQFKGLIDDSEFKTGEIEISCLDLQGFWDMVYFEVEKIKKCFSKLDKCKDNEWKFIEENFEKPMKKKVPVVKDQAAANKKNDSLKSAAKQRLAEAKKKMLAQRMQQNEQNFIEVPQPSTDESNLIQNLNTISTEKDLPVAKVSDKALTEESNKKFKKDTNSFGNVAESLDTKETSKESAILNGVSKKKSLQQKSEVSVKNKENAFTHDKVPAVKNVPVKQTKPRGKTEVLVPNKNKRKSKETIKLQCVTRSAMKAMLAEQNAQKS